jgi:hypothetical protein
LPPRDRRRHAKFKLGRGRRSSLSCDACSGGPPTTTTDAPSTKPPRFAALSPPRRDTPASGSAITTTTTRASNHTAREATDSERHRVITTSSAPASRGRQAAGRSDRTGSHCPSAALRCASPRRSERRCTTSETALPRFHQADDFSMSRSREHCACLWERPLNRAWSHLWHPHLGRYPPPFGRTAQSPHGTESNLSTRRTP